MKRMKLQDCCVFISDGDHQAPPKSDEGVPFITISNITPDNRLDFNNAKYVPLEYYEKLSGKSKAIRNDILYSVVGSFGKPVLIDENRKFVFQRHIAILRPDPEKVIPEFLYYSMLSPQFYTTADYLAIGAAQRTLSLDSLRNIEIEIPTLEQQKRVVDVIAPIDKKVRENAKINDYLEEMAKTIYDYWFVQYDFPNENNKPYKASGGKMVNADGHIIPEGWTFCKVQDIISNICTGLNPRDNFKLGTGDIKYITVKNLTTNGTLDFTGCDTIDEFARAIVHNRSDIQIGDILFASIAPLGRCYLIQSEPTDWDINESVFSIRANTDIVTPAFLYLYFMSDAFIKHATSSSTGSIFKGIRINTLLETELCVPPLSVILKFEDWLASTFPLKSKNYEEIQKLSNLRDWLLPMLMNGQATIED
mgnify:CR=1 FL=1